MLDQAMLIEVAGEDAGRILHNLTTNHIQLLHPGQSVETFVTDVRGWVVAHGLVYRCEETRWWLLGQHHMAANVAAHIDRYIIREKAAVTDLSRSWSLRFVSDEESATSAESTCIACPALGSAAQFCLSPGVESSSPSKEQMDAWQRHRIAHFWPLMGVDIWEKCIPQELDRTEQAISFTKGCYLGQETIARLDARGQIQKKLCLLKLDGPVSPADKLLRNDQEVGHITSVSVGQPWTLALAVIRRGHFDLDTRMTCNGLAAQVINSETAISLQGEA